MNFKFTTKIVGILVAVAAAVYYFVIRKNNAATAVVTTGERSADDILNDATSTSAKTYSTQIGETVTAATMSAADEEYNLKRQEYIQVLGTTPSRTLTYDQLQRAIDDFKEKKKLLEQYVSISGDTDLSQEQVMGVAELELAIASAQKAQQDAANKAAAEKKAAWQKRQGELNTIVNNFASFLSSSYTSTNGKIPYLTAILAITKPEEKAYIVKTFSASARQCRWKYLYENNKTTSSLTTACDWYCTYLPKTGERQKEKRAKLTTIKSNFSGVTARTLNAYGEFA